MGLIVAFFGVVSVVARISDEIPCGVSLRSREGALPTENKAAIIRRHFILKDAFAQGAIVQVRESQTNGRDKRKDGK